MIRTSLVEQAIDVIRLTKEVSSPAHGAISVFLGTVRATNGGRGVDGIEYSAYGAMAEQEMGRIAGEASNRFGVSSIVIEHRLGLLKVGDISVGIAVGAGHRAAAIDAMHFVIEELKRRVPIWKLEQYIDGTREWVHASGREHAPA